MKYSFNVELTDKIYYDYNKFMTFKSEYGKGVRVFIWAMCGFILLFTVILPLVKNGFDTTTIISIIPSVFITVLAYFLYRWLLDFSIKSRIKSMAKKNKRLYSTLSVMEFYEDSFCETTKENKSENKYCLIERVSVISNKAVYIHMNHLIAYIIPSISFKSPQEYEEFIEFIKEKSPIVDIFKEA